MSERRRKEVKVLYHKEEREKEERKENIARNDNKEVLSTWQMEERKKTLGNDSSHADRNSYKQRSNDSYSPKKMF